MADLEEPVLDQFVQVELGHVASHSGAGGGLLAAHRLGLSDDEAVQVPPYGLGQRPDAGHTRIEVIDGPLRTGAGVLLERHDPF